MKTIDRYLKWVEWSEEDKVYVGRCPDLITGIHGDDSQQVYKELCQVVAEVLAHYEAEGRALPQPTVRPMQDVV